jgi:hypothetical protein
VCAAWQVGYALELSDQATFLLHVFRFRARIPNVEVKRLDPLTRNYKPHAKKVHNAITVEALSFDQRLAIAGIILGIVALGVTLAMDAKTKGEFGFAVGCFILSASMLCLTVGVWQVTTPTKWHQRFLISGCCFALICVLLMEGIRWTHGRHLHASSSEPPNPSSSPPKNSQPLQPDLSGIQKSIDEINKNLSQMGRPRMSAAQMQEIKQVDEFIAGRDENDLRQEFGLPEMKETNIQMIATIVGHSKKGERFDPSPYFAGKDVYLRIDLAEGHIRHYGGSIVYDYPDANRVYLLLQPAQYSLGMKKLLKFETSSELPAPIIKAVKDFHDAVSKNTDKLVNVLNDAIKKDPDYYLRYNDFSSPAYFHQLDNMWFDGFIQLRPKADKIRDAIRQFLGVK